MTANTSSADDIVLAVLVDGETPTTNLPNTIVGNLAAQRSPLEWAAVQCTISALHVSSLHVLMRRRKPTLSFRLPVGRQPRIAHRQFPAGEPQLPPRRLLFFCDVLPMLRRAPVCDAGKAQILSNRMALRAQQSLLLL